MSSPEDASDPWGIPADEKAPPPPSPPSPPAPEEPSVEPPFSQVLAAAETVFGGRDRKPVDDLPDEPPSWLPVEDLAGEPPPIQPAVLRPPPISFEESSVEMPAAPTEAPTSQEPDAVEQTVVEQAMSAPVEAPAEAPVDWWAGAGAWPITRQVEPTPESPTDTTPIPPPEVVAPSTPEWPLADAESVFVLPDWGTEGAPAEPAVAAAAPDVDEVFPTVEMPVPEPSLTDIEAVIHQIEIGGQPEPDAEQVSGPWPLEVDAETPLIAEQTSSLAATAIAPLEIEVTPPVLPPGPPTVEEATGPVVAPRAEEKPHDSAWGTTWRSAAQGWVEDEFGRSVWRPIVSSTGALAEWAVDTYLGLVAADVFVEGDDSAAGLRLARRDCEQRMVEEALRRGAHAVLGVTTGVSSIGGRTVVTVAGTAVTLKTA